MWIDISERKDSTAWEWSIRPDSSIDEWPGVSVYFAQGLDGQWYTAIEFEGEYQRCGDPVKSCALAREQAQTLVDALRGLWPEKAASE